MTTQIQISILSGQDGGLVIYETVDDDSVLVFGGDLEAAGKYLTSRMGKIIVDSAEPRAVPIGARDFPSTIRRLAETGA